VRYSVGQRGLVEVEHLRKTDRHHITYIPQSERDRSVTMLVGDLNEAYRDDVGYGRLPLPHERDSGVRGVIIIIVLLHQLV
jgi:hypothetical protein